MKNAATKNSQKKTVKKFDKKVIRFFFFGVASFVFVFYSFNLIVNMVLEIVNKYQEKDELNQELEELKEEENILSTDVLKLQDPEYVGRYLREKYFYSKSDEYIIKLPDEK